MKKLITYAFLAIPFLMSAQNEGGMSEEQFEKKLRKSKLFQKWDVQDDGFLSLQEWTEGIESTYPDHAGKATYSQFMKWDLNADHYLNFKEVMLGLYGWADEDSSESLSDEEWQNWKW